MIRITELCKKNDLLGIKRLFATMEESINLNVADDLCFRYACENGNIHLVKYLLSIPNNKIKVWNSHNYAFRKACANGHENVVKFLLSLSCDKIDINVLEDWAYKKSWHKHNYKIPKYLLTIPDNNINIAANASYILEKLTDICCVDINPIKYLFCCLDINPIKYLSTFNLCVDTINVKHFKVIKYLLSANSKHETFNQYLLVYAIETCDEQLIKYLLSMIGGNITLESNDIYTYIYQHTSDDFHTTKYLLTIPHNNLFTTKCMSVFMSAQYSVNINLMKYLLSLYRPYVIFSSDNFWILKDACNIYKDYITRYLFSVSDKNINIRQAYEIMFIEACKRGNLVIIKLILSLMDMNININYKFDKKMFAVCDNMNLNSMDKDEFMAYMSTQFFNKNRYNFYYCRDGELYIVKPLGTNYELEDVYCDKYENFEIYYRDSEFLKFAIKKYEKYYKSFNKKSAVYLSPSK